MPRNRVIYATEAVYAGPSPATGFHWTFAGAGANTGVNQIKQLYRIQNANYDFGITRRDINQYGELASIDRLILEQPTVNLSFGYILNSFTNEKALGFTISSGTLLSAISGILNKNEDERNYFIKTHSESQEALANTTNVPYNVIAIGNGFISNYSANCTVGDFPKVSVSVEALNMNFDSMTTPPGGAAAISGILSIPAVNPADGTTFPNTLYNLPLTQSSTGIGYSALRPGDVSFTLSYDEGGVKISDAKIQSFNLGVNFSRTPLLKLGSKYAFAREINFPMNVDLSITATVGDLTSGKLSEIINNNTDYNLVVNINKPGVSPAQTAIQYIINNANLNSQSFSSSIGSDKSVTLNFSTQVGSVAQSAQGFFMSGIN